MAYKNYSSYFKAKVVIEVLQGENSLNEIAAYYNLNPNMVSTWNPKDSAFSRKICTLSTTCLLS